MHKIQSYPITRESFEMDDYKSNLKIPDRTTFPKNEIEYSIPNFDTFGFNHDEFIDNLINYLENLRLEYNALIEALKLPHGDPDYVNELQERALWVWKELIRWLPEGWLQTRTVTLNYETIRAMCSPGQRRFHKLNEWSGKNNPELTNFITWARTLPYALEFIFTDEYNAQKEAEKTPLEKAIEALRKVGVSAKNTDGTFRTISEILKDVADVYGKTLQALAGEGIPYEN